MKSVIDLLSNISSQAEKFAIYAMKNGLEEVALAGILAVEELEELKQELLVDELLGEIGLEVGRLEEAQKELVNDLEMRPSGL